MPTIINLTPHDVRVMWDDRADTVFPASGRVARLAQVELACHDPGIGAPVQDVEYGHLTEPVPRGEGVWYIVSLPTALATQRPDFLVPYGEVRSQDGVIMGCRMLGRAV